MLTFDLIAGNALEICKCNYFFGVSSSGIRTGPLGKKHLMDSLSLMQQQRCHFEELLISYLVFVIYLIHLCPIIISHFSRPVTSRAKSLLVICNVNELITA